ncbi:MmgE/PrpD family protein [Oleispirillum naphthae]|uniref:MmgE/PrpD family protein n=1 Tax=Oleispirillum naphthae TaxID=2838853 RepID=UPI0030825E5D
MTATRELAAFASGLAPDALSGAAERMLARAVTDFVACTIAGAATASAKRARCAFPDVSGGAAQVLGSEGGAPAHVAAFLNAQACHALEFDDLHGPSIYHPGAPTISAALAVADRTGADAATLRAAIVAGYEVGIRLGAAAGTAHYARHHTTGTVGALGAAAAAGRVLGLDAAAMADALGIAVTHAAALWAFLDDKADSKPFHAAHAAMIGVLAADLAAAGVRGARTGIEGPHGFLATLGGDAASPGLCAGLGAAPEKITELTIKAYPCCGHTHTGIAAAGEIRARMAAARAEPGGIAEILVDTYAAAIAVAGAASPATAAEAAFSYPHIVAWVLSHGSLSGAFTETAPHDPAIARLARRVKLHRCAAFDAAYPASQPVRLAVRMHDGEIFTAEAQYAPGTPVHPLSDDDFADKIATLLGPQAGAWTAFARRRFGLPPDAAGKGA